MQLPEFTRSTTLRWTVLVAGTFAAFIVALLGFVYSKTESDHTMRSDRVIASQMGVFADLSPERRLDAINEYLKQDPGRVQLAGLFGSNGRRIAGNLESLPGDLKTDNAVQSAVVDRIDETGREKVSIRRRPRAGRFRLRLLDQRSGWRSANSMAAVRRAFGRDARRCAPERRRARLVDRRRSSWR